MIKKFLSLVGLVLASTTISQAQTVQDIFGNPNYTVTWFGIDYSHAKIVGTVAQFGGKEPVTAKELRDRYYVEWNELVLAEPEKYTLAKMIDHKTIIKDIRMIKDLNAAVSLDSMEVAATPYYTREQIQSFVSVYPIESKPGIGLVFITECMNKPYAAAYYHVVFFNTETKKVLHQERISGNVAGIGIRNYWATSFYNVMMDVQDERYPSWRKRFGAYKPAK